MGYVLHKQSLTCVRVDGRETNEKLGFFTCKFLVTKMFLASTGPERVKVKPMRYVFSILQVGACMMRVKFRGTTVAETRTVNPDRTLLIVAVSRPGLITIE